MNYYQRLRDIRHDHDLTQAQVARILRIGQSDYSKYERGVNMMGVDKYLVLAKFYNVSLDYLTGLTNTPKTLDGSPYSFKKVKK
ncbi:MAG: helix-turn-helix transcriptional regulator [Ruminococcaceae bacterium]|nr:helix-turn-helix transcriptional regulator [Oscillospiraceae bacterium]